MKYWIVLISLLLHCNILFSQNLQVQIVEDKKYVAYQKAHDSIPLTWQDFKAIMPNEVQWQALTNTNTAYYSRVEETPKTIKVAYTIQFYFDRNTSSKKAGTISDYLLKHEQMHFDIAWYHYQLFLKDIKSTQWTLQNYNTLFAEKFKTYLATAKAMQEAYDTATAHSINHDKQEEWNLKVNSFLTQLALE
ncbi:MAG: hypothetical protein ORN55_08315 [Chitinophagaceae bacterium]|nr:hypothetical protein [Chitinophagaceae bacterium]